MERHLSDEQIQQFQKLYFQHFGVRISKAEALKEGLDLVRLMKVLAGSNSEVNHADSANQETEKL